MKVLKFLSFALPTFVICCEKSFICQSCFGHVFSLKFAVYYERSQKYPPFWDLAGSHKRKFKINFDKFWKEKRKEFWWILMKFASARSRRYRRNFENFLHREWELVETLQKLQKTFFLNFFSKLKKWVKIAFFAFWVKIFQHFLIDAAEILSLWGEMGAYSTRKWRENRKIRRYSRERAEAKLAIFKVPLGVFFL